MATRAKSSSSKSSKTRKTKSVARGTRSRVGTARKRPAAKKAAATKPARKKAPATKVVGKQAASKARAGRTAAGRSADGRRATAPARTVRGELGGPQEALWREYARTHDPAIRNTLMEQYLPVVSFIAERLLLTLPRSIDVDDLKSAGIFGLMDAIDGFDIDRAIKFKTYCSNRIRGAILDELRSQDWVPRLVRLKAHQINRAQSALEARHGRAPTHAEMAMELGVELNDYTSMVEEARAHTVRSLSETWDDGSSDQSVEKIDFLHDMSASDPADLLNQDDVMRAIIRSLNRKEKQIILMYYRDGLTMKQIGGVLQLTESRVCQIHSNVMKKLKLHLEGSQQRLML